MLMQKLIFPSFPCVVLLTGCATILVFSLSSEEQNGRLDAPVKLTGKSVVNNEEYEHKISLYETELRDLRGRYLHVRLEYAELEAQREQLVMKLKARNWGRNCFS